MVLDLWALGLRPVFLFKFGLRSWIWVQGIIRSLSIALVAAEAKMMLSECLHYQPGLMTQQYCLLLLV